MREETSAEIDAFWCACFNCAADALTAPGVRVVSQGGDLGGYRGAYTFRRQEACILAVPPEWVARTTEAARNLAPGQLFMPDALADLFGDAVERVIGPAYRGYADETDLRPAETYGARLLTDSPDDHAALAAVRAACTEIEWAHSAPDPELGPIFGVFDGMRLLAAASYERQAERLLHIRVLTHPGFRGRGLGRGAVSALCQHGLVAGGILQYQALLENMPSLKIARALGFQAYAQTIAVRLR
jgi:GNAT superfamily N-acetyltransferase